jgi:AraC-like DNA-binding protein
VIGMTARPEHQVADGWEFESFRDALSQTFAPVVAETDRAKTFEGAVTFTELGPLRLAQVAATPHITRRNSRLIRRADLDYYKLTLQITGQTGLIQDDRTSVLTPGDLALYDTTRPYELRFDDSFEIIVLMFPRSLLQVPEASVQLLTGRRIPANHGLAGLIGSFVSGLAEQVDRCGVAVSRPLGDAVLNMLAAAIADELGCASGQSQGPRQAVLLQRIKSHIEDQLGDPGLGPDEIAAAHHISPRYLRKLFESEGDSVARWIRSRRLEHCRRDLGRPDLSDRSVSAVAARWGFTDAAHFSRLFRSAFGQSPREYRHGALVANWPTLQPTA